MPAERKHGFRVKRPGRQTTDPLLVGLEGTSFSQIRAGGYTGGTTGGAGNYQQPHGGTTAPDLVIISVRHPNIGTHWTGTVGATTFEVYQWTVATGAARATATVAAFDWIAIWL